MDERKIINNQSKIKTKITNFNFTSILEKFSSSFAVLQMLHFALVIEKAFSSLSEYIYIFIYKYIIQIDKQTIWMLHLLNLLSAIFTE